MLASLCFALLMLHACLFAQLRPSYSQRNYAIMSSNRSTEAKPCILDCMVLNRKKDQFIYAYSYCRLLGGRIDCMLTVHGFRYITESEAFFVVQLEQPKGMGEISRGCGRQHNNPALDRLQPWALVTQIRFPFFQSFESAVTRLTFIH